MASSRGRNSRSLFGVVVLALAVSLPTASRAQGNRDGNSNGLPKDVADLQA